MSFWSRDDAVCRAKGNTDHWTKMKLKSNVPPKPADDALTAWLAPAPKYPFFGQDGTSLREQSFNNFVQSSFHGNVPGRYHLSRPSASLPAITLRNSYHDRAKEGFRYWLINKPLPTKYGRVGIGSFKTLLGVGNAPRT